MGREAICHGELGDAAGEVRALLESHELVLRGAIRAKLPFAEIRDAEVRGDALQAQTGHGALRLHLGADEARKWLDRMMHPPSLAQKLGIRPAAPVHLVGAHPGIAGVLAEAGAKTVPLAHARLVFTVVAAQRDLQALERLVPELPVGAQLWVLRRKGKAAVVKEAQIMGCLRAHGFAPSKTAAWSDDYAADRYGRARAPR